MVDTGILLVIMVVFFCTAILWTTLLLLSRDVTKIPVILSQLTTLIEHSSDSSPHEHWATSDGRYHADSFDELLLLMVQDPNTPLSPEQVAAIKSIFEEYMGMDKSDDSEPWKQN